MMKCCIVLYGYLILRGLNFCGFRGYLLSMKIIENLISKALAYSSTRIQTAEKCMALRKFLCPAGDNPDSHRLPKASPKVINAKYGELRDSSMRDRVMGRGEGNIRNFLMKKEQQLGSLQVFMVLLMRPENILLLKVALETGEICTKGN